VSLLTSAHCCLCPYVAAGHRSQAVVCMWAAVFVCGWLASVSGSHGGSGVIGGHWRSWVVMKVGGGEERGWQR